LTVGLRGIAGSPERRITKMSRFSTSSHSARNTVDPHAGRARNATVGVQPSLRRPLLQGGAESGRSSASREITTTLRETLVWAPPPAVADELRALLAGAGNVVLDADDWELTFFNAIPDTERHEFDPARILDVEIGVNAGESLEMLVGAGRELSWHRWQRDPTL